MAAAVAVAEKARFWSSPNPWVGAVVVAKGQIIGEGATGSFQIDSVHAEISALKVAG